MHLTGLGSRCSVPSRDPSVVRFLFASSKLRGTGTGGMIPKLALILSSLPELGFPATVNAALLDLPQESPLPVTPGAGSTALAWRCSPASRCAGGPRGRRGPAVPQKLGSLRGGCVLTTTTPPPVKHHLVRLAPSAMTLLNFH